MFVLWSWNSWESSRGPSCYDCVSVKTQVVCLEHSSRGPSTQVVDPVVITVELSMVGPFLVRMEESVRSWVQLVSRDLVLCQDTVPGGEQQSMA